MMEVEVDAKVEVDSDRVATSKVDVDGIKEEGVFEMVTVDSVVKVEVVTTTGVVDGKEWLPLLEIDANAVVASRLDSVAKGILGVDEEADDSANWG